MHARLHLLPLQGIPRALAPLRKLPEGDRERIEGALLLGERYDPDLVEDGGGVRFPEGERRLEERGARLRLSLVAPRLRGVLEQKAPAPDPERHREPDDGLPLGRPDESSLVLDRCLRVREHVRRHDGRLSREPLGARNLGDRARGADLSCSGPFLQRHLRASARRDAHRDQHRACDDVPTTRCSR